MSLKRTRSLGLLVVKLKGTMSAIGSLIRLRRVQELPGKRAELSDLIKEYAAVRADKANPENSDPLLEKLRSDGDEIVVRAKIVSEKLVKILRKNFFSVK